MSCLELEFQPELDVSWGADGTVVQGLVRVEVGFVLRIRVLTRKDGWDTASAKFPGNVTRVRAEVLRHPTRCANDSAELPPPQDGIGQAALIEQAFSSSHGQFITLVTAAV